MRKLLRGIKTGIDLAPQLRLQRQQQAQDLIKRQILADQQKIDENGNYLFDIKTITNQR